MYILINEKQFSSDDLASYVPCSKVPEFEGFPSGAVSKGILSMLKSGAGKFVTSGWYQSVQTTTLPPPLSPFLNLSDAPATLDVGLCAANADVRVWNVLPPVQLQNTEEFVRM